MIITASSINPTPILTEVAQTGFPFIRSCMMDFKRFEIILDTDIASGGAIDNLLVSVKPGLWVTQTGGNPSVNNVGFDINIPQGSAVNTVFNATWAGNQREKNYAAKLTLKHFGGFWRLEIAVEIQQTCDLGMFIPITTVTYNLGRALNSINANGINLSNGTASVYTQNKRAAMTVFITDATDSTSTVTPLGEDAQHSWYDSVTHPIKNNGVVTNNLFINQPNVIEVEYTNPLFATFIYENAVAMLIRVGGQTNNSGTHYSQDYSLSSKKINSVLNVDYPDAYYWAGFPQNDRILPLGGTNLSVAGVIGTFQFEIDSAMLVQGEKYRLIVLYQFKDPAPPFGCRHFTVITDALTVTDQLPAAIPTLDNTIDIEFDTYNTDGLELSPRQRVRHFINFDGASYNAIRGAGEFTKRAAVVELEVFSDEITGSGTFRQYYTILSSARQANNQFTSVGGLDITFDDTAQTLQIEYNHRLRYEQDQSNVKTRRLLPLPETDLSFPSGNMDMNGRTVILRFTLRLKGVTTETLNQTDEFVKDHTLVVDAIDTTTLTFEAQNITGDPIITLCSDEPTVCIESTGGGTQPAFNLLDKEIYSIDQIREFDGFTGVLPTLQEAPLISSDPAFVANKQIACIDATQLDIGVEYRFSTVTKKDVIYPCYAPVVQSVESIAIIQRMAALGVAPNALRQQIIHGIVNALKTAGVWNKTDCLYFIAAHAEKAARLNWKNPTAGAGSFELVPFNGIELDFITDRGHQKSARAIGKHLQTNFKPATDGVHYNAGGSHFSVISGNNYTPMGFLEGSPYHLYLQNDGTRPVMFDGGIYGVDNFAIPNPASNLATVSRSGNDRYGYANGAFAGTKNYGVDLATGCVIIHGYNVAATSCSPLAVNDSDAGGYTSTCGLAGKFIESNNIPFVSLGGYLTEPDVKALHCIVRCYLLSIGFEYETACVGNAWDDSTFC